MFGITKPVLIARTSSAADSIVVDVLKGTARVMYKNGRVYDYTKVSRRALLSLVLNQSVSLGFFINQHLLCYDCKCAKYGTYKHVYSINV